MKLVNRTGRALIYLLLVMPRSHIHGSHRRFHYGSNPTGDPGNDNFRSPIQMHSARTTTYDHGCNTEMYGLIRVVTDDAGSYPWLILRQIRECVTWALGKFEDILEDFENASPYFCTFLANRICD